MEKHYKICQNARKTQRSRRKLGSFRIPGFRKSVQTKTWRSFEVTLSRPPLGPYRLPMFLFDYKNGCFTCQGFGWCHKKIWKKSNLLRGIQDVDVGADPADNESTGVNYQFMLCIHFPRCNESQGYIFTDFWSDLRPKAVAGRIEVTEAARGRGCLKLFRLFRQTGQTHGLCIC